ncbi:MAG: hypothetical protein RLZZ384_1264 [Pseudomonadota bacterium]|jgi:uncharacterized lipoprotein NlpE involved in copper resistance
MPQLKLKNALKTVFTGCFLTLTLTTQSVVFAQAPSDAHHEQQTLDWPGIYNGFTPCDDCKGVKTTLALNANNSYILITQYVGKSPRDITEKGKFVFSNQNTIILTPRDSEMTRHYFVDENKLVELDKNGVHYSGKDADRYVLRRNDVVKPPADGQGHGH